MRQKDRVLEALESEARQAKHRLRLDRELAALGVAKEFTPLPRGFELDLMCMLAIK